MIALLSPAKTLDYINPGFKAKSAPTFKNKTNDLIEVLKQKKVKDIMNLMHVSEKLGQLNYERYQQFSNSYTVKNSKSAISAFKGDVFLGFDAETLTEKEIAFANDRIRILSGLYGMLKPLDKMQPYRLEMGTSLKTKRGKNLYEFWGSDIALQINKDLKKLKSKTVINLASKEYFTSVDKKSLDAEIIDITFKEYKNGDLKFISFNAKKARGMMARYIVKEKPKKLNDLKGFNYERYSYLEDLSTPTNLTFVRDFIPVGK